MELSETPAAVLSSTFLLSVYVGVTETDANWELLTAFSWLAGVGTYFDS